MQLGLSHTSPCTLCPRQCRTDRAVRPGFCGAPAEPEVSAITLHTGEEPPLSAHGGIVNIFFSHCNLHCIYCQNHLISGLVVDPALVHYRSINAIVQRVCDLLPQGNGILGFVTAAHYAHLIPPIVEAVRQRGFSPTIVYNSSGYERLETLRALEGLVDIYLPDLKYLSPTLASALSHAPDYPQVATDALLEMQRQVGSSLKCDPDDGTAFRGIIVRHLVLPGHIDNSLQCLEWLADHFPPTLHLSLMAQYFPPEPDPNHPLPAPLDRTLTEEEYNLVAQRFQDLGFNGWLQQLSAQGNYRPHFENPINPFQEN